MKKSAITIVLFGVYAVFLGAMLVVRPNALLRLFAVAPTDEVWIRVLGAVVVILGFYYIEAARTGLKPFFRASVYGRFAVLGFLIALVLFASAPPALILFGLVDALAAEWTRRTLKKEAPADSLTTA